MSDQTITFLQGEVTRLQRELSDTKAEAKDRRVKLRKANEELADVRGQLTAATTERDQLSERAKAAPSELQTKLDEALGKLRTIDHRAAFDKLAAGDEFKLDASVLETAWQLSGYRADADQIDETKVRAAIEGVVKSHPILKAQGTGGATSPASPGGEKQPKPRLELGGGEGGRGDRASAGLYRVTTAQMRDPAFTLDPVNKARIAEAQKAGTFEVID